MSMRNLRRDSSLSTVRPHRSQILMNYRDVAIALVKYHQLHEGLWRVALTFGAPVGVNAVINGRGLTPSMFVPVPGISLVRDEEVNDLNVDAAVVNPMARILMPN